MKEPCSARSHQFSAGVFVTVISLQLPLGAWRLVLAFGMAFNAQRWEHWTAAVLDFVLWIFNPLGMMGFSLGYDHAHEGSFVVGAVLFVIGLFLSSVFQDGLRLQLLDLLSWLSSSATLTMVSHGSKFGICVMLLQKELSQTYFFVSSFHNY